MGRWTFQNFHNAFPLFFMGICNSHEDTYQLIFLRMATVSSAALKNATGKFHQCLYDGIAALSNVVLHLEAISKDTKILGIKQVGKHKKVT
jgi:hypothetical protein